MCAKVHSAFLMLLCVFLGPVETFGEGRRCIGLTGRRDERHRSCIMDDRAESRLGRVKTTLLPMIVRLEGYEVPEVPSMFTGKTTRAIGYPAYQPTLRV